MIRSMTAFARAEQAGEGGTLSWEIRSVNHRYLELSPRLPDGFRDLEPTVRQRCRERLVRGKVEVSLRPPGATGGWRLNEPRVQELAELARRIDTLLGRTTPANALEVLNFPGVLTGADKHHDRHCAQALTLLDQALDELISTREREGEQLRRLLQSRLTGVREQAARMRAALPGILDHLRQRLRDRIEALAGEADPQRLEQEIAVQAQKMDVEEELDRLDTHADEVERILNQGGAVGRRLDFLMQELNREANTLASKSVAGETSQAAVELKVLIEQMREQIQNLE